MQPHLAIYRLAPDTYSYSFSADDAPARHGENTLESLARCLDDAADSLGHYFAEVRVSYEGKFLGNFPIAHLRREPGRIAHELMGLADRS